ncbi:hypothetical protein QBC46DRAFT_436468, partial [Diplogelasinospora grovesii]
MMSDVPGNSSASGILSPTAGKSTSVSTPATAISPPPLGHHFIRRAMTVDEGAQSRRRPTSIQFGEGPGDKPRRRSSTFSEYSLSDARRNLQEDILNPGGVVLERHEKSFWSSLPLAFALLPAIGGIFFKNGAVVVADIMLLGLAAVFLHWIWYHSAQEVRVREEAMVEMVFADDSEGEGRSGPPTPDKAKEAGDAQGGQSTQETQSAQAGKSPGVDQARRAEKALKELYRHEVMALLSCLAFPAAGAYLLHATRNQLSRPSEGLVSNYNLTIFLLAAELHPLSHLFKLVQARTLHLQRIVHSVPRQDEPVTSAQVQEMLRRLEDLEARAAAASTAGPAANGVSDPAKQAKQKSLLVRDVRNEIQPELDALNRAVRRYEKKATVLAFQTESRLGAIDTRLNDAIALAAAATRDNASQWSLLGWLVERFVWMVTLPLQAVIVVITLPLRTVSGIVGRNNKSSYSSDRSHRDPRRAAGKGQATPSSRLSSTDRLPSRLSKR